MFCVAESSLPLLVATIVVAAVNGPGAEDITAAIGAAIATTVVVLDTQKNPTSASKMQIVSVILSSFLVGITAPGLIVYNLFPESWHANLTWHIWVALGFVTGLAGWIVVKALMQAFKSKVPKAVEDSVVSALDRIPGVVDQAVNQAIDKQQLPKVVEDSTANVVDKITKL